MRLCLSQAMAIAVASFGVARGALGQPAPEQHPSPWAFTIDVGEFVQGNRSAVESWLRRNSRFGRRHPLKIGALRLVPLRCRLWGRALLI